MFDKLLNSNNIVNKENLLKDYKQEKISLEKTKITENKSKNYLIDAKKDFSEIENKLKLIPFFKENFEILNYLDSGCESKVYKIINKKRKKEYALKYIHTKIKKNLNELKIISKLKNKNIIDFYGYFPSKEDNSEMFILENAKYGNLRQFQIKTLKRAYLSESMLCFLANQIINGLYYCHKCKIAHMDIKPQNIVIDEYLNAKIIDFSISINYGDKNLNNEIKLPFKGTSFYMPSEIMNSKTIKYKDINKVDMYALGVILYNLAFGKYPYDLKYEDEDNYKLINQKINRKLEINNENKLSSYFIDFVSKLLESDINKRINIYEALQHPWIKGAQLLLNEKENIYNVNSFVIKLITDNIKNFNDYLLK
jgi:serine/threonine protein kinase